MVRLVRPVAVRLPALILTLLLAGCTPAEQAAEQAVDTAVDVGESAGDPIGNVQTDVARETAPVVTAVQDAVAAVVESLPEPERDAADARVVAHIVKWEVSGERTYTEKYQGIICPGGASGPTWGIGYDGGHQSQATIRSDWSARQDVERLASTSGQTGAARCAASRAALRDVRVPYGQARQVFADVSMPLWSSATRRVYPGIEALGRLPEGALVGNTYNRGTSMIGSRATEKRAIRDVCVPQRDVDCLAAQLVAQCRLWTGTPNGPGLCNRRKDEARLAQS